jgi:hypothetical protein
VGDVYPAVNSVPAEENQTEQDTPPRVAEAEQNSATVHKQKMKISNFIALKGLCHEMRRWTVYMKNFFSNQFLELQGVSLKQENLTIYGIFFLFDPVLWIRTNNDGSGSEMLKNLRNLRIRICITVLTRQPKHLRQGYQK